MLSPKRRKGAAARGRRNLILFGSVLAGLTALIAFVGISSRAPKRIMPPESPEMTAKRESPGNAFATLREAIRLLPKRPAPICVASESDPKIQEPYFAKPGSLGALLGIDRPDDDQGLLLYLWACQPAVEKVREGLKKEYFLYPRIGTPEDMWRRDGQDFWGTLAPLGSILTATMFVNAQRPDQEQAAVAFLSDALRLAERLGEDGGVSHYMAGASMMETTLRHVSDAAATITSSDVLRAMRDAVNATSLHERPARPYIEFTWRTLDNWASQGGPQYGGPGADVLNKANDLLAWWAFTRQCRHLRKNKEQLLDIAELSYPEFIKRRDAGTLPEESWMMSYGGLGDIQCFIAVRTELRTIRAGALIAVNLELYRREHGQYPDSLDALVPDYLDVLPTGSSHITEEPFVYRLGDNPQKAGDYWLYPGPERNNFDRINERAKRENTIHYPANEEE